MLMSHCSFLTPLPVELGGNRSGRWRNHKLNMGGSRDEGPLGGKETRTKKKKKKKKQQKNGAFGRASFWAHPSSISSRGGETKKRAPEKIWFIRAHGPGWNYCYGFSPGTRRRQPRQGGLFLLLSEEGWEGKGLGGARKQKKFVLLPNRGGPFFFRYLFFWDQGACPHLWSGFFANDATQLDFCRLYWPRIYGLANQRSPPLVTRRGGPRFFHFFLFKEITWLWNSFLISLKQ